jgi:cytoskeletal protein CcmA (bactofilin family)
MWNRKKEDDFALKPVAGPPAPSELAKEGIPMSTLPGRSSNSSSEPHYESTRTAVLGKSVIVKGQIYSREDLTIDGEVEGTVELQEHRLTVGPNGKVRAAIKARELVVLGTIHGDVETTDKIDIRKEAKLVGDIKTARIVIEDGAYFKGNIDIVRAEAARPVAAPAPKPAASAATTAAPVTGAAASAAGSGPALAAGAADSKR